jgi:hypothetical protein
VAEKLIKGISIDTIRKGLENVQQQLHNSIIAEWDMPEIYGACSSDDERLSRWGDQIFATSDDEDRRFDETWSERYQLASICQSTSRYDIFYQKQSITILRKLIKDLNLTQVIRQNAANKLKLQQIDLILGALDEK